VVLLIVVPTFLVLCDWQVRRALGGNELSWAYVFEWPFFAGYAVFVWWKLVHETLLPNDGSGTQSEVADPPGTELERTEATEEDPEEDPELAAYNRYLAELHAHGRPKRW